MRIKLPAIVLLFLVTAYSPTLKAQTPATYNSADIYLQLKKLNVLGSVLYIAAHPDDENTRLLAYFSKEKQYRTGYLSLTRGDGGQNLIGDDQGIELGLIRTQELLSARRIDGAEQFFSRAYDFGFCKTAKEAMDTWGHDKILSDVVWVIRKFQPDVIICRFPGDERAGHGHHQASNLLAVEAYKAAADANMFPEQLQQGVQTWQAKRILWNTFNFGTTNTTDSTQFKIDVGVYNSLLGKSYGEIASESRSQHKSQGFGVPRQRGQAYEYFKSLDGDAPKNDLMEGVVTDWGRVKGNTEKQIEIALQIEKKDTAFIKNYIESLGKDINEQNDKSVDDIQTGIKAIISNYNFEHPENSLTGLVELYRVITSSQNSYWQKQKAEEVKNIIIQCSGIFAEATSAAEYAVQGDSLRVQFFVNKRNNANVTLDAIRLNNFDSVVNMSLGTNKNFTLNKTFAVAKNTETTQPYWLVKPLNHGSFDVDGQKNIGKPENDADYQATFIFDIYGSKFFVTKPVRYKYTDPVKGELYEPVVVIPAVIVSVTPSVVLTNVQPGNAATANPQMQVQYKANTTAKQVPVKVNINQGSSIVYTKDTIVDFETGKIFNASIPVKKIFDKALDNKLSVDLFVTINGKTSVYTHYLRSIQYDHIPHINYFYRDNVNVVNDAIKTTGKTIGYITGAGDKVPQALQQLGYEVKLLNEATITDDKLKQFDAVIAGIRAYNTHDWLTGKYDVLMRYIQNGGNYIVQYNTSNFISTVTNKIGPYPFTINRTRVTDENAKVNVLLPNNSALNYPNKITEKDFNGWLQERSIYQAEQIDNHYQMPLSMHDANEPETNGSLVIGKYGKGNFVYTGLVFFRELPAGVPGAYRLMANLIALPKNK